VGDEPGYVAMGGQADAIATVVKERHRDDLTLAEALRVAVDALGSTGTDGDRTAAQLEVAVLDRRRAGRTFRRIGGAALTDLLAQTAEATPPEADAGDDAGTDADQPSAEAGDSGDAGEAGDDKD
jgi:proteasome alpha subunit